MTGPKLIVKPITRIRNDRRENTEAQTKFFGLVAGDSFAEQRYAICQSCEELRENKFCRRCGCYMPGKTKIALAKCPINKWPAISK